MIIRSFSARKVFNSRNEPTIQLTINTSNGKYSSAAPSGASTGIHEVFPYSKKGIDRSIDLLNELKDFNNFEISSFEDFHDIEEVFNKYDSTEKLEKIGGNSIIAFEFALLKAISKGNVWEFLNPNAKNIPVPLGNCMGGGSHFKGEGLDIQEFLLMPKGDSFKERAEINRELHALVGKKLNCNEKNDEGGWAPKISNLKAFEVLKEVIEESGKKATFGIDMAASQFFKDDKYIYNSFSESEKTKEFSEDEQIDFLKYLVDRFKLSYIEDPLYEESFCAYGRLKPLFKKTLICGDDLICTNLNRLKRSNVNCIIIKPNQVGSIIKTKEIVDYAIKKDIKTVISHRSGETMDATISHLAVAWNIPYIKCGIFGKEREAKINELIKIEKYIKP